jgi:3-oxoacyl-[acyl-carrier protein] reductase/pteridine reductase
MLNGKLVLVTGAAKRIGKAIALRLHAEGARVLIHYNESRQEALDTAAQCGGAPTLRANLASVEEIRTMFRIIQRDLGGLDYLVNNAARFTLRDPLEITEADWEFIHSVNLKGTFFCAQEGARLMLETRGEGRIVNLSSLGGMRPWANHAHYCASKAGVIMMTQALAKAWAPKIAVNAVAPGVIELGSPMTREAEQMVRATPMQRTGTGEEVADAVAYFLSTTRFITGQNLAVDGGLALR